MELRNLLTKGISIQKQQAGRADSGPLGPVLRALAKKSKAGDGTLTARSPVGSDLARIISKRSLRVLFVNTGGSGVAPWRGLIILDADYIGEGQIASPSRAGMVAHELTHLLQREINQPHYWPGGGLRPFRGRRWVGDSTNYMEVLAYLVGWTVEYDLRLASQNALDFIPNQLSKDEKVLATTRERLALFTGAAPREFSQMICDHFPDNLIYKQNYRTECQYPDRRIPPGTWHAWLRQMGFSRSAVDHILVIAAQGKME